MQVGSRQSSSSSLSGRLEGLVLQPKKKAGRGRPPKLRIPPPQLSARSALSVRSGSSSSVASPRSQRGRTAPDGNPNLAVLLFVLKRDGKYFVPSKGGSLSYDPNNEKHLKEVARKRELHHKRCQLLGVRYDTILLSATIDEPLDKVGGATQGYCQEQFPPIVKKYK